MFTSDTSPCTEQGGDTHHLLLDLDQSRQQAAELQQQLAMEQDRRFVAEQELERTADAAYELWESMQVLHKTRPCTLRIM